MQHVVTSAVWSLSACCHIKSCFLPAILAAFSKMVRLSWPDGSPAGASLPHAASWRGTSEGPYGHCDNNSARGQMWLCGKSVAMSTHTALPLKCQQCSGAAAQLYLLLNAFPHVPSGVADSPAPTTNNLDAKLGVFLSAKLKWKLNKIFILMNPLPAAFAAVRLFDWDRANFHMKLIMSWVWLE